MEKRYILLFVAIVLGVLIFFGSSGLDRTVSIGNCTAKFATDPVTVTSDLCPGKNRTCIAQPADQQNNAVVDVLLCACDRAKSDSYSDDSLNSGIATLVSSYFGYNATAQDICDQQAILAKRSYG